MFKIITSLTMFATGLLAQAQSVQTRNVEPFSSIEVSNGVELIYTQGAQPSMKIEAGEDSETSEIVTEFKNNRLLIYKTENDGELAKVYLTAPAVAEIKASNESKIRLTNLFETPKLTISLASASVFWGSVKAEKLQLYARSGGVMNLRTDAGLVNGFFKTNAKVNISGTAVHSSLQTQSGALCNARNYASDNAVVSAVDNSSLLISTKGEIDVNVADTAKVTYYGKPDRVALSPDAVAVTRNTDSRLLTNN